MRLRREPNNRSKPTHLKYFRTPQRQSPSESEVFPVLIQPNFLMDFLSDIFCPNLSKHDDPNRMQASSKRSKSGDQTSSHSKTVLFAFHEQFPLVESFPLMNGRQARA
jgi:hypothetical protein